MVSLVLFLLGAFAYSMLQARQLIGVFKERVNLMVEISPEANKDEVRILMEELKAESKILTASIDYITKEDGAAILQEEFGEAFFRLDMPNPLYDVIRFNVKSEAFSEKAVKALQSKYREKPAVFDLFYQDTMIDQVVKNVKRFGFVLAILSVLMVLIGFTIINSTIRLALYSNRFLIKNMQLVGAKWGFISRPYLWRSVRHGLLSACLAIAGLIGLVAVLEAFFPELKNTLDIQLILIIFGALMTFGVLISLISTYFVINKYLRMRVYDLY